MMGAPRSRTQPEWCEAISACHGSLRGFFAKSTTKKSGAAWSISIPLTRKRSTLLAPSTQLRADEPIRVASRKALPVITARSADGRERSEGRQDPTGRRPQISCDPKPLVRSLWIVWVFAAQRGLVISNQQRKLSRSFSTVGGILRAKERKHSQHQEAHARLISLWGATL